MMKKMNREIKEEIQRHLRQAYYNLECIADLIVEADKKDCAKEYELKMKNFRPGIEKEPKDLENKKKIQVNKVPLCKYTRIVITNDVDGDILR